MNEQIRQVLTNPIFYISLLVLFMGFNTNFWKSTSLYQFQSFQLDTESFVVGGLAKAEREGIFAMGGLSGRYQPSEAGTNLYAWQYHLYVEQLENDEHFETYNSHPGGQTLFFAFLDRILPLGSEQKLVTFRLLTSLFTAVVLSLIVVCIGLEFGRTSSLFVLTGMVYGEFLTLFGNNLYWSFWSFFLPVLAVLFLLEQQRRGRGLSAGRLCGWVFGVVFVKCLFSGYEYMTTTLLMMVTPLVYYALIQKWGFIIWLKRSFYCAIGTLAAILCSFVQLAYQISRVEGTFAAGFGHISSTFLRRTAGNPEVFPEFYRRSLEAGIPEVLGMYWSSTAMDFNHLLGSSYIPVLHYSAGDLILLFVLFSAGLVLLPRFSKTLEKQRHRNRALLITLWFSFLAPLSWLVMFKGHSFIHTHINPVVWYMPFALLGFALIGVVIGSLGKDIYELFPERKKVNPEF